ncbi:MAG: tetratricopeptide repeat protein, partial [Alphaproteobacteria bacterium]
MGIAEALFVVGSALRQDAGTRLALQLMRLALYMQPSLTIATMTLGDMLEGERRETEALALYRGVPPDSPLYFSARLRVADVLRETDKLDGAIKELDTLAEQYPDSFEPLATEGDYLRSAERFADAAKAYDRALARLKTVDTQDWSLYYARGVAFERAGEWPSAEKDFLEALKL